MRRLFIILHFTLFTIHYSFGQIVRRQAFSFLNLPQNVQTAALGGTNISARQADINSLWASPALVDSNAQNQASLSISPYLATTQLVSVVYGLPFKTKGTWAVGMQYLNYGTMTQTDAAGNETGTFTAADYALAGSYAQTEGAFTLGANLKMVGSGIETYQSWAIMADVGGVFKHPKKDLTIGIVVRNVGIVFKPYFTDNQLDTPLDVQLGVSIKPQFMPIRFSVTAHHLYQWDIVYNDPARSNGYDANGNKITKKITTIEQLARHLVLGVEVMAHKNIKVVLGYNHLRRQELRLTNVLSLSGLSGGVVFQNQKINFGYAYSAYHLVGGLHTVSFGVNFRK
jgi:hypothetical protein